jgi:ribonuclease VapC
VILLDASAVLALLLNEPGADMVAAALASDDGAISLVTLAEVLEVGARKGLADPAEAVAYLRERFTVVPIIEADAIAAAELYPATRAPALSLADRFTLALGRRLGVAVFTAEQAWAQVPGVNVRVIR